VSRSYRQGTFARIQCADGEGLRTTTPSTLVMPSQPLGPLTSPSNSSLYPAKEQTCPRRFAATLERW
jgi:hypothetical protein